MTSVQRSRLTDLRALMTRLEHAVTRCDLEQLDDTANAIVATMHEVRADVAEQVEAEAPALIPSSTTLEQMHLTGRLPVYVGAEYEPA